MRLLIIVLASVGFLGYIPIASGTFGSLAGIPLFWAWDRAFAGAPIVSVLVYAAFVLAACWVSGRAEHYFDEHDSHKIVIDEVAGYVAATLFLHPGFWSIAVAFVIFRALDVIKPFPANHIDAHFPGGYGVVLDDVVSGIYANVLTRLVLALVAAAM